MTRGADSRRFFRAPGELSAISDMVQERMLAYSLDGNGRHVIVAYRAVRGAGLVPTEALLELLDQALENVRLPGRKRRARYTLRDAALLRALSRHGHADVPAALPSRLMTSLAAELHIKAAALPMALSRLRRRLRPSGRSR